MDVTASAGLEEKSMEMFLQDDYIMDLNTSMPLNPMTLLEEGEADDHALRGDRPSNLQRMGFILGQPFYTEAIRLDIADMR
jgi:hypothetical protein